MASVEVVITRITDDSYPIWIEFELTDILGKVHVFQDKLPIVEGEDTYWGEGLPQPGVLRCEVVHASSDEVIIDTNLPDGVETISGLTQFSMSPAKVRTS